MREKHSEKQSVEPWFEWEGMRSPRSTRIPKDLERELNVELEIDGDPTEPIPQLPPWGSNEVAETEQERVGHEQSKLLLVQNRMQAMMVQVTTQNDKVSEQMLHLNRRMRSLTWGIFSLGIVTVGFMVFSYVQPSTDRILGSLSFFSELFHSLF